MKRFRFSLTFLILSSLSFLLVLTWILLSLISFKTAEKDLLHQKNEEARLLLSTFVAVLPGDLSVISSSAAGTLAHRLSEEPGFVCITVVGSDGAMQYSLGEDAGNDPRLAGTCKTGAESYEFSGGGARVSRYAPVVSEGRTVGAARLIFSLQREHNLLGKSRHYFLAYFMLDFLLLLAVGSLLLSRFIVSPVRKLLAATERITSGDYAHRAQVTGSAEISELADSFNAMVETLKSKRDEVESHVRSLELANRDLQSAREESLRSEKMASVGLLAAGTAHEIGTPLAAIMGYAAIMRDELADDPEKSDYIRRIEQDSQRIDRIVHDLLDYARPTPAGFEEVHVGTLLTGTLAMLERQGVLKRLNVTLSIPEKLPELFLDPHQLQQVLINLVINARDAMPDGGDLGIEAAVGEFTPATRPASPAPGPLVAGGRRREDFGGAFRTPFTGSRHQVPCVRIEVSDSGGGIEPGNLERIFDPFFTTKEPGKGTGLGLAISARVIDSFRGRITVESSVGHGSRFIVWLPAGKEVGNVG